MKDTIPVWMSLVLMVAGAIATYWLAPKINAQFEVQAARREYLVKNLESFSGDTKNLIDVIAKSVNEKSKFKYDELVSSINPNIAKLQFSGTQLLYVVPQQSADIVSFQRTLRALQNDMLAFQPGDDPKPILDTSKLLLTQSLVIYEALLARAGLGDEISKK
ncbi:hypothetical protein GGQ73_004691 [Rhizobium skierniewicense]|uniref:Uncharacterized protein n=1 Tax=Rhizobium skierniewicense TaxID=984260 RepID=A0A7W6CAK7_9HYPH|nr:hypothetical protein [Rhizobium skierniewicense]MBB3948700.1 hypothetical protein [Rhizobium skierniewicense]